MTYETKGIQPCPVCGNVQRPKPFPELAVCIQPFCIDAYSRLIALVARVDVETAQQAAIAAAEKKEYHS